jgi:2,4-dienoyl-CoA reductase-like NADH-dependent reductase (Old Yellow Enzyme family)
MQRETVKGMDRLWEPVSLGRITLPNRLAMAPMTRDRSTPSGTPTHLNARYYAQRASVGLIVSEGTQPSDDGQGYLLTPGMAGAPLNDADRGTFFAGGERGYTAYPSVAGQKE